jgi:peptide-methionine (R)-S-oxide reductase
VKEEPKWNHVCRLAKNGNPSPDRRVEKSATAWRDLLTPQQFQITRQHGTEAPYSNEMCSRYEQGMYACVCCDEALFDSGTKFDSGTGWPSFTAPVKDNVIKYLNDESHGMTRIEVQCNICDAHLGHVFPQGRRDEELRYCINGVSLKLID